MREWLHILKKIFVLDAALWLGVAAVMLLLGKAFFNGLAWIVSHWNNPGL